MSILSATSGGVSIVSFASIIGAPAGIASTCFNFAFSISTGIIKTLFKTTGIKKKRHNNIAVPARRILNKVVIYGQL